MLKLQKNFLLGFGTFVVWMMTGWVAIAYSFSQGVAIFFLKKQANR